MFQLFTDRARRVVILAQEEARMLKHNWIGTEHLLLGLIHEGEGAAGKTLESLGVVRDTVITRIVEIIGEGEVTPQDHIKFTPRSKKSLELALRESLELKHDYISTEHLLLGLVRQARIDETGNVAAGILEYLDIKLDDVRRVCLSTIGVYTDPLILMEFNRLQNVSIPETEQALKLLKARRDELALSLAPPLKQ